MGGAVTAAARSAGDAIPAKADLHFIADAGNMFQTDTLFFGVLIFTATGLAVVALLDRLERRFERWRPSVGATT